MGGLSAAAITVISTFSVRGPILLRCPYSSLDVSALDRYFRQVIDIIGLCGAPGRIRTSDPLVRSQMLYPAELRARGSGEVQYLKIADNAAKGN
jgi:hypothetical protein